MSPAAAPNRLQADLKRNAQAWAYLAPAGIILALFWFLPVVLSFLVSFTNWHGGDTIADVKWVGFENYRIAFSDPRFIGTLWNTLNYVIWSVPLTIVVSLGMAVAMNTKIRGVSFFRTCYFLPYITTWVAISIVWSYFFQKNFGLANYMLEDVLGLGSLQWLDEPRGIVEMSLTGMGHLLHILPPKEMVNLPHPILQGPSLAMFAIILTSVWRDAGYFMIIFLAGLQGIDSSYYEAASIDGAGPWHRFRNITWPLLSPVTFFVLIVAMIGAFKVFVPIMIMTPDGGPQPIDFHARVFPV